MCWRYWEETERLRQAVVEIASKSYGRKLLKILADDAQALLKYKEGRADRWK